MDILIIFVAFILSGIPLYISVKLLGGKTTILKTALVLFIGGLIFTAIQNYFDLFGGLLAFLIMLWLYKEIFSLGWFSAFFAWLLQFLILAIFIIIYLIFGIGVISLL